MTTTPETPHNPTDATAATPAPPHDTINPFVGVRVGDFVREGAGLLLLLLSLVLPWSFSFNNFMLSGLGSQRRGPIDGLAAGNIAVVLLVILAVLSLSVTYLARAKVLPETWGPRIIWSGRAGLTAPYLILVIVTVIIDAFAGNVLGISPVLGFAGAILLASPRAHELTSERHRAIARRIGLISVFTLAGLFAIVALASLLQLQTLTVALRLEIVSAFATVLTLLALLTLITIVLLGVILRREPARLLLIAVGSAAVAYCLLHLIGVPVSGLMLAASSGFVLFFAAAGGALMLSPAGTDIATKKLGAHDWVTTTAHALGLLTLASAVIFVEGILLLVTAGFSAVGTAITLILLSAVIAVGSVIARRALLARPAASRTLVLAVAGIAALLGLVEVIVAAFSSTTSIDFLLLLTAFGLPITVAACLTLPAAVRAGLPAGAPVPVAQAAPVAEAPTTIEPSPSTGSGNAGTVAEPVEAPSTNEPSPSTGSGNAEGSGNATAPAPTHGFTAAQASDPATDAATLFRIAQEAPELLPQLAANPSTYPDLLDWLASLDRPEVTAAVAARADRA